MGRDAERREAAQALRDGSRGVVLAGAAGVGKSALARVLAGELEADGHPVRFVLGTETAQAVPLGAFRHALTLTDAREPTVMLAAAYEALAAEPALLIVVDDVQHLDPLSALLVQQLAVAGPQKLIVTMQNGATTSDAVTALWKEQLLLRMDLEPFTREQTGQLAAAVLGGDIDEHAVGELHRFSAGSPLYLRGALNAALADAVLVCDQGRWRLHGQLRASDDLYALIASRLDTLSPDERDVVEVVSTAEVLDWDVLVRACDADAIARVERRGAIQVLNDAACTVVRPGHPIVGEVARSRCSTSRSRQINTQLAVLLQDHVQSGSGAHPDVRGRIQLARFMVGGDVPVNPSAIADAAASAVTMSNLVLGEELARYALDHGAGVPAAIVLADALSRQGRGEQAEELLARNVPATDDEPGLARWGCLRASNLFFGCARPDAAHTVLTTLRERICRPPTAGLAAAMEAVFAFFVGDVAGAITLGGAALDDDVSPTAGMWAALGASGALALSGRSDDVAAVVQAGERAAESCESGLQRYWLAFAQVSAHTADGELAAARRVCDRYAVLAAGSPQAEAIVSALSGRVELARGCLPSACEALRAAMWAPPHGLPPGWLMIVAAWLAQAEGMRGNGIAATATLARADSAAVGPSLEVFRPEWELARGWATAAAGDTAVSVEHALRAARSAKDAGMDAVELTALHTALRFGATTGHGRIRQLVHLHGGPLAEAIGAHSRGLARHDPAQLVSAADAFEALGALALAGDAAAHAAREYARAGCRGAELESAARARWLAAQGAAVTPALRCAGEPLPLTEREWEIADLVDSGLSNRQIADLLCLSVRTVDGHLYRVFAKVGVEDRSHLARLVRYRRAR